MVDLSQEMTALADRLGAPPAGGARVLEFIAARGGEGASTVAREFARAVAPRSPRGVWLVELDLMRGAQFDAIAAHPDVYGDLGEPLPPGATREAFFTVTPRLRALDGGDWPDANYLSAHPVGRSRFWVTRFRKEALRDTQRLAITAGAPYWTALRAQADWIVVDAPSLERSRAGLVVAAQMDATLLVLSADAGDPRGPTFVRDHIAAAGGRCVGVVLNRLQAPAPRLLRAFAP